MPGQPIDRLRAICLALPEAVEKETWGDPTFRVRDRIFAMEKRGNRRVSLWCKAPPGSQMVLVGADPERFFVPPYVGHRGWIGVWLDHDPDWDEVTLLVRRSYRLTAPNASRRWSNDESSPMPAMSAVLRSNPIYTAREKRQSAARAAASCLGLSAREDWPVC